MPRLRSLSQIPFSIQVQTNKGGNTGLEKEQDRADNSSRVTRKRLCVDGRCRRPTNYPAYRVVRKTPRARIPGMLADGPGWNAVHLFPGGSLLGAILLLLFTWNLKPKQG